MSLNPTPNFMVRKKIEGCSTTYPEEFVNRPVITDESRWR